MNNKESMITVLMSGLLSNPNMVRDWDDLTSRMNELISKCGHIANEITAVSNNDE